MRKLLLILFTIAGTLMMQAQEALNEIDFRAEDSKKQSEDIQTYSFSMGYRIEAGYVQDWQHSRTNSYPNLYLHGARVGGTFDFRLPYHITMQTGLMYSLTYGSTEQHFRNAFDEAGQVQFVNHQILKHNLVIPIRATYTQKLWRELALYFYAGPQLQFSVSQTDHLTLNLNEETRLWCEQSGIRLDDYNRIGDGELHCFNVQFGVGGGLQWAAYRLYSGYDFGLNNLVKAANQHSWEWGWFVSFSYEINYKK